MLAYYAARASAMRYELLSPALESVLSTYVEFFQEQFRHRRVLEIACGTGYWTEYIAETADYVLATDAVPEMLAAARSRDYRRHNVEVVRADAYSLASVPAGWTAGFHFQWFSHVPKSRASAFLSCFHSRLSRGARVVFGDNNDHGADPDQEGNLYQYRHLLGALIYRIIKNCPRERELLQLLEPWATSVRFRRFERDWFVWYELVKKELSD